MYSPQQQIFDTIFAKSEELGNDTYDYLPEADANYPFVFIGEQFDTDRITKSFIVGEVIQTVHVYHTHKQRGDLSDIIVKLRMAIYKLKRTANFNLTVTGITGRIITEPSTVQPLSHGVMDITIKFD